MNERWKLISSGVQRKDIRISGDKILLRGSVYSALDGEDPLKFVKQANVDLDEVSGRSVPVHTNASVPTAIPNRSGNHQFTLMPLFQPLPNRSGNHQFTLMPLFQLLPNRSGNHQPPQPIPPD